MSEFSIVGTRSLYRDMMVSVRSAGSSEWMGVAQIGRVTKDYITRVPKLGRGKIQLSRTRNPMDFSALASIAILDYRVSKVSAPHWCAAIHLGTHNKFCRHTQSRGGIHLLAGKILSHEHNIMAPESTLESTLASMLESRAMVESIEV